MHHPFYFSTHWHQYMSEHTCTCIYKYVLSCQRPGLLTSRPTTPFVSATPGASPFVTANPGAFANALLPLTSPPLPLQVLDLAVPEHMPPSCRRAGLLAQLLSFMPRLEHLHITASGADAPRELLQLTRLRSLRALVVDHGGPVQLPPQVSSHLLPHAFAHAC